MAFTKPLVDDRVKIPDLAEEELIQSKAFDLTKFAIPIVAVLTAVAAFFGGFQKLDDAQDTPERVVIIGGIYLVLALIPLALSIVYAADFRARAHVTGANLALRAAVSAVAPKPADATPARRLLAPDLRMSIAIKQGGPFELVLAVEEPPSPEAMPRYLVGGQGSKPHFVKHEDIMDVKYAIDPRTFKNV